MIVYYAVGGGLGHLTRARAFLRAAGVERETVVLTASPFANDRRVMGDVTTLIVPAALRNDRARYRAWIHGNLARLRPGRLVLDTFPAGLFHELEGLQLSCEVEYVARYLRWPQYAPLVEPMRFSRTWVLEPLHPDQERMVVEQSRIVDRQPRLIDPDERCGQDSAAVCPSSFSLVVHSGAHGEVEELVQYARKLRDAAGGSETIVVASPMPALSARPGMLHIDAYPALPLAHGAVRIITAAGFNAMRQFGRDPRHHVLPFARRFDDQHLRASRWRAS